VRNGEGCSQAYRVMFDLFTGAGADAKIAADAPRSWWDGPLSALSIYNVTSEFNAVAESAGCVS
jgi:hypothetical protein